MARVLGVGGIFMRAKDPKALGAWYQRWLGFEVGEWGASFKPRDMPENSLTVWSLFRDDTDYFAPSDQRFMFNLIVDDLDAALAQVREGGGEPVGGIQEESYGRFGWFLDPEGNKVELWQPGQGFD